MTNEIHDGTATELVRRALTGKLDSFDPARIKALAPEAPKIAQGALRDAQERIESQLDYVRLRGLDTDSILQCAEKASDIFRFEALVHDALVDLELWIKENNL